MGTVRWLLITAALAASLSTMTTLRAAPEAHAAVHESPIVLVDHVSVSTHRHHRHRHHWAWLRGKALGWAETQAGKPYEWGQAGPYGYDCSGLVYAAYEHVRHHIPRDTYEMLGSLGGRLRIFHGKRPPRGALAFFGSGHVELLLSFRKHLTFGAEAPGTNVGRHHWSQWWHPTMFVVVV